MYSLVFRSPIVLSLVAFSLVSCRAGDLSWPEIKRRIGEDFPGAAQLSIDDYRKNFPDGGYLVDVREPEEYDVSHIRGAVHLQDADDIVAGFRDSGKDVVVLYCSVGHRSSEMAQEVQAAIDAPVYNLDGSIFEWANSGNPVYRDGRRVDVVHPYDERWGKLLDEKYHADVPPIR